MKPPIFDYKVPVDLKEAVQMLNQNGDDSKILAGGQSLMPLMNMRMIRPKVLIDINHLTTLDYIKDSSENALEIGALTRQSTIERSSLVSNKNPLLGHVMPYIGHFEIRNRGTIGGSIVHADPAAELPAITVLLNAEFTLENAITARTVKAGDFFVSYLETDASSTEILTKIRIPDWPSGWGWGFEEVYRRSGDFALAGAASMIHFDEHNLCDGVQLCVFGVSEVPHIVDQIGDILVGTDANDGIIGEVKGIVSNSMDYHSDVHASSQYRKEVIGTLAGRSLSKAIQKSERAR